MTKPHLLLILFVAGCGDSSGVNITKTVGTQGGTVSHTDGTSVTVPMGALSASANITISSVDAQAPAGTVIVGPAYDFGPSGTTFAQPVTITLPFDTAKIPAGRTSADVRIYTAPRGSTQYTVLATALASPIVSTTTSHFTVYLPAVPAVTTATDLGVSDMATLKTDLAMAPPDFSAANCTPVCTTGTTSCGCSETCSGHTYVMMCSQTSTVAGCFCEIDNATQSTAINNVTCNDLSTIQAGFFSGCAPG